MSQKRKRTGTPVADSAIFRSSPIIDRSSRFIAIYSPSLSAKELQALDEIKTATHKIAAWRKPSSQQALNSQLLIEAGHDDDGEKYGGKTLEKVMISTNAQGAVVVARWYGGVMLGPVRFDHMKKCAHEAISGWTQDRDLINKKNKIEDERMMKERLVRSLPERDNSITVLRGLLAEKKRTSPSNTKANTTPTKVPIYRNMPLSALQKLEQVRDATIAWILSEIEKAESILGNVEAQDDELPAAKATKLSTSETTDEVTKN